METNGATNPWTGKKIFTTGEAALVCKVSQQTIIRCFDAGRLEGFRVPGSKFRRIPREELLRFMRQNGISTESLEGDRQRILLIDDHADTISTARLAFERDGRFDLRLCSDAYDAGLITMAFRPHAIVVDLGLSWIDAPALCRRLRTDAALKDIRLIVCRGPATADRAIDAGVDGVLSKPFTGDALLSRLIPMLGLDADTESGRNHHSRTAS
ncbi:MAG: response regulator [Phycisphaerales bacterium]|nr:response regulator [Phycisphaerales bacterium]